MWQPDVDKLQRQSEIERLEQAEKYILYLKQTIADMKKRIEKLENKQNDK